MKFFNHFPLSILIIFLFFYNLNAEAQSLLSDEKRFESLLSVKPQPITSNSPHDVLPIYVGDVSFTHSTISWEKHQCFKKNSANLEFKNSTGEYGGGTLKITVSDAGFLHMFCEDMYVFATPYSIKYDWYYKHGEHVINFETWSGKAEYEYVRKRGISIFRLPKSIGETAKGLLELADLLNPTDDGERANIKFLKENMNVNLEQRPHPWDTPNINVDDIKSGDCLVLSRLRGRSGAFNTLEKWVTGAYAGHVAVCLRNPADGKLYVAESGHYNPKKEEIIDIVTWEEWLDIQKNDDSKTHIALLPLHRNIRAKFNEREAWDFANSLKGKPYGYHNVIFSWIDTATDNYPSPVDANVVACFMTIWNEISSKTAAIVWKDALNKRLGTQDLSIPEILYRTEELGLEFGDVLAKPEQDHWVYSDGKSVACTGYVIQIYKAAGLFHPLTNSIQGTEFTVKDVYELKFYENDINHLPKWCNNEKDSKKEKFCQILGQYHMELPGYNTIEPYANMNERCPSLPPSYDRIPKNC